MTFDEIVSSLRGDTYRQQSDGFYSNGIPCPTCGSVSVMLDPTPVCATCGPRVEQMHVDIEILCRSLDRLNESARLLPPEAKRQLRDQLEFWQVHLMKLAMAVTE